MSRKKTALFTILLVCVILFYRKYDAFINPQFWAEDGLLFEDWLNYGIRSFFSQYAGYINLFPRLVACVASFFPLALIPAIYNYTCFLVIVAICVWLFSSRLHVPHKPLFALAIVLVPHGGESFLNLPSIYWFMSLALVFLALQDHPKNARQIFFDYFVLFLAGLSGPCIVYGLPLFGLRCLAGHLGRMPFRKRLYDYGLCFCSLLLVAFQFYSLVGTENPTLVRGTGINPDLNDWVAVLGARYAGGMFLGERLTALMNPYTLAGLTIMLPILLVILLDERPGSAVRNLCVGKKGRLYTGVMFLLFAFGIAACVLYKHQSTTCAILSLKAISSIGNADRYFFVCYIMVAWTLILCLESGPFKMTMAWSLLLLMFLASMTNFQWAPFTDHEWRARVARYGASIPTHPVDEMISITHIPINPPGCFIESKLAVNVIADETFLFPVINSGGAGACCQVGQRLGFSLRKGDIIRIQIMPVGPLEEGDRAFIILYNPGQKSGQMICHDQIIFSRGKRIIERDVNEFVEAPWLIWRNWKADGSSLPETKIRICVIRPKS